MHMIGQQAVAHQRQFVQFRVLPQQLQIKPELTRELF